MTSAALLPVGLLFRGTNHAGYYPRGVSSLEIDQARFPRDNDRLQSRVCAEHGEDAGDVIAHGRPTKPKFASDLVRRAALGKQTQDVELAWRERIRLAVQQHLSASEH
jgi:hypothetical protein